MSALPDPSGSLDRTVFDPETEKSFLRGGGRRRAAIVVMNLPVPDDRRVWEEACALRSSGWAVSVVCPATRGHEPGRRSVDGIDVQYLRTFEAAGSFGLLVEAAWNSSTSTLSVLRRLRGLDVVQVCNPPDTLAPLLTACRMAGVATVYDQHDVTPAMAAIRGHLRLLRWVFLLLERWTVRRADLVLTSSEEQAVRLRRRYRPDVAVIRSAPSSARPPAVVVGAGCKLGYLGVIGSQEGLGDLFEAMAIARRRGADVRLGVAGDGPFLADARRSAAAQGVAGAVDFHGWLRGEALERFLTSIDAMVVPDPESEYNHHCSMNKVIEAMARGLPILMRPLAENQRLTGTHPWIAQGWSSCALADVLVDFAASGPGPRAEVGRGLRARYGDIEWPKEARRYVDALEHLAGTSH